MSARKIVGPMSVEGSIKETKHVAYYPFEGQTESAGSFITISCHTGDAIIRLSNSFLKISGKILQSNGTSKISTCELVDNYILNLFSEAKLMLGNQVVETVRNVGLNSLFKTYIFGKYSDYKHSLAGHIGLRESKNILGDHGEFEVMIDLKNIFDLSYYTDNIYFTRIEIHIQRYPDDSNGFRRVNKLKKQADNTFVEEISNEVAAVTFEKIALMLEHVQYDSGYMSKILAGISKNILQPISFPKSSVYIYPNINATDKHNIALKTYNYNSMPKYIAVGFIKKLNEWGQNAATLIPNNCAKVTVFCNSLVLPTTPWTINREKNQTGQLFKEYIKFHQFFNQNSSETNVVLSHADFNSKFPIFCVPINMKLLTNMGNNIDISIELESTSALFTAGTSCVIFTLHEEKYNFSVLRNELFNVNE
jgi:hypothetical protein